MQKDFLLLGTSLLLFTKALVVILLIIFLFRPKQNPKTKIRNMNNKLLDVVARSCQNRCPLPLAPPHSHTTQTFAKQPVIGKGNYFEFPPLILYLGLQIQNLEAQRQFKKKTKKAGNKLVRFPRPTPRRLLKSGGEPV